MQTLKNILCPVDFSDRSKNALEHAVYLARLYKADLTLLHVITVLPGSFGIIYGVDLDAFVDIDNIQQNSKQLLEDLKQKYVPYAVTCKLEVRNGNVAEEIKSVAEEAKADLIVMSTDGAHGLESLFLGSNASKMITVAPCPVLTYGENIEAHDFRKIMIPVTRFGIRELRKYFKHYFQIMAHELHLVSVMDEDADEDEIEDMKAYLRREVEAFAKEGTEDVKTDILISSRTSERICEYAEENDFSLIMMNTHGRKGLGRFVLGSVTQDVVNHCRVPVLTIRPVREEAQFSGAYHSWFPV